MSARSCDRIRSARSLFRSRVSRCTHGPAIDADTDDGEQQGDEYVADHGEPAVLDQEHGDRGADQDQADRDPDERLPAALAEHDAEGRDADVVGPGCCFWLSSACRQISARPVPANTSGQNIFPAITEPGHLQQEQDADADDDEGRQLAAVLLPCRALARSSAAAAAGRSAVRSGSCAARPGAAGIGRSPAASGTTAPHRSVRRSRRTPSQR